MKQTITTKITKVFKNDKKKDGTPLLDKNGKPFWKVAIKTEATGDQWYSCLAFRNDDAVMRINEGAAYTILVWEENGFSNFKIPTKTDLLEDRVTALEASVFGNKEGTANVGRVPTAIEYPEEEIDPMDIPF